MKKAAPSCAENRPQQFSSPMKRERRVRKRFGWRWLIALGLAVSSLAGLLATDSAKAQGTPAAPAKGALSKYTLDLTSAAEQGRFDSFTDRRDEINRAIAILSSPRKNNPVVLSDSPAVRDMIVAGVARRIVSADVPSAHRGKVLSFRQQPLFCPGATLTRA
jgi:ATP-dependent Clp protease ATP-binding subunit ClpA